MRNRTTFIAALAPILCFSAALSVQAESFKIPAKGDLIGYQQQITARYEDTLADLGEAHNLGYFEMLWANPGTDAWLPGEGSRINLPTQYIMPEVREGIVINLAEYRLYYFPEDGGEVITYPVGIGTDETPTPQKATRVEVKIENPTWYPPASIRQQAIDLGQKIPAAIPPGPDNPLGQFAIKLELPGYLLHGTNKNFGIGTKVSHGCIRLFDEDIKKLAFAVPKQTPVLFINQPIKLGFVANALYLEVHPEERQPADVGDLSMQVVNQLTRLEKQHGQLDIDYETLRKVISAPDGIPHRIGHKVGWVLAKSQGEGFHQR